MSQIYFYFCILMTFLAPGFGHILWGHALVGLSILLATVLFSLGSSYFTVLGAWAAGVIIIFSISIIIGLIYSLFKLSQQPLRKSFLIAGVVVIFISAATVDLRRVYSYTVPSEIMAPLILAGDSIAVDRSKKAMHSLKVGDIVLVNIPERSDSYIRKVQSVNEQSLVVIANDPRITEQTVLLENIVGRALYVVYSFDSEQKMLRWDRILNPSF